MKRLWVVLWFLLGSLSSQAEQLRHFITLPSNDTSGFNIGPALQSALGVLGQETGKFRVSSSDQTLTGFTPKEIRNTLDTTGADVISFVYLEPSRISLFLFDRDFPSSYLVSYRSLENPPDGGITSEFIEGRFRESFNELMKNQQNRNFQRLPTADVSNEMLTETEKEDRHRRAEESKTLFRELAALDPTSFYLGTSVGMARFSGSDTAASTVNFGAVMGKHFSPLIDGELGIDVFTYAMAHIGGKYHLPIAEKLVSLRTGLELAMILGNITDNRGFDSSSIQTGAIAFGPCLSLDIPLLGATMRGDLRLYFGSATVFVGTYGIIFAI